MSMCSQLIDTGIQIFRSSATSAVSTGMLAPGTARTTYCYYGRRPRKLLSFGDDTRGAEAWPHRVGTAIAGRLENRHRLSGAALQQLGTGVTVPPKGGSIV